VWAGPHKRRSKVRRRNPSSTPKALVADDALGGSAPECQSRLTRPAFCRSRSAERMQIGAAAVAAGRLRRPARWLRSARIGPRARAARRRHPRAGRQETAAARLPRRAGSAGAVRTATSHSLAGRRLAARRALRHRLVAILYSQVRSDARSSVNPPMPCQADSIVTLLLTRARCGGDHIAGALKMIRSSASCIDLARESPAASSGSFKTSGKSTRSMASSASVASVQNASYGAHAAISASIASTIGRNLIPP
jgi:hypothetical protein